VECNHKERKDKEAKAKRSRQEALHRKIAVDPLPQDVCERELFTTWVSPVMRRVATEKDRLSVLRKTRAETRQCKMQMPVLQPSSKDEAVSTKTTPRASSRGGNTSKPPSRAQSRGGQTSDSRAPSRGGQLGDGLGDSLGACSSSGPRTNSRGGMKSMKAASWAPLTGMLEQDTFGSMGKFKSAGGVEGNMLNQMRHAVLTNPMAGQWPQGMEARAVGGSREMMLPAQTLPRVGSAGGASNPPAPRPDPSMVSFCGLVLEPPASLDHRLVERRLEDQAKEFRKNTFAEYMKEHDIFTGDIKVRFDQRRLQTEEEASFRISGEPKRIPRHQLLRHQLPK